MSRSNKNTVSNACVAVVITLLIYCGGCSALGFPANSVAHTLTDNTKAVIEHAPRLNTVARERAKTVNPVHYLQPGDELLIELIDNEAEIQLPADQRVLADGTIDLGKYGRAVIASMTLEQAESTVHDYIETMESKPFIVNIRLIQGVHRYYVIGEVNSPGAFPLIGHETVLDAIMEAGGLTNKASACDLLLARPTDPCSCRVALPVCYRAITQLGDTTTNFHLKPGDRIFVGKQSLCEEVRSYCHGGESCERCCKVQRACANPNLIDNALPDFVSPNVQVIPAPPAPAAAGQEMVVPAATQPPTALADPSSEIGTPQPVQVESLSDQPGNLRAPRENVPANGLDGELDFKAFRDRNFRDQ